MKPWKKFFCGESSSIMLHVSITKLLLIFLIIIIILKQCAFWWIWLEMNKV